MDKFDESVVNVDVHLDAALWFFKHFEIFINVQLCGGVNFKLSVV